MSDKFMTFMQPEPKHEGGVLDNISKQEDQRQEHKFSFTGRTDDMIVLSFVNLFFNVITFSIYRFWGRTKVRHYIWSNIQFNGDPFEYTGTGGELFKGTLIVGAFVFLPLAFILGWARSLLYAGDVFLGGTITLIVYLLLLWLAPLAYYKAQGYRMSRTRWRGIRAAMADTGTLYASTGFGLVFLLILTFGLTYPFVANTLWRMETNDRRFGSGRFHYSAPSEPQMKYFLAGMGLSFLLIVLILELLIFESPGILLGSTTSLFVTLFFTFIVLWFFFAPFKAKMIEHFLSNMHFEGGSFDVRIKTDDFIGLHIGNFFILAFSLGVLYPVVQMRTVRFFVERLTLSGPLGLPSITQSDQPEGTSGEGLAEGFDMGTI